MQAKESIAVLFGGLGVCNLGPFDAKAAQIFSETVRIACTGLLGACAFAAPDPRHWLKLFWMCSVPLDWLQRRLFSGGPGGHTAPQPQKDAM